MLRREDGQIDWRLPAVQIERMIRAYDPWPGAWTLWRGRPFKLLSAGVDPADPALPPGRLDLRGDNVRAATGAGALLLYEVQPAGKRPLAARAWRNGIRAANDQQFGM
jgi:methionyl-tRNA formyltransferase